MSEVAIQRHQQFCWMRQIEIRLTSIKCGATIIYGGKDSDQLNITVNGHKYISALKDNGSVTISNLTYSEIYKLILGEFYIIEIWAGYKTTTPQCFFKGYVSYISNKINERKDHECYILFASRMVAQYSQKRMNLCLNSGINLYAAYRYICLKQGINSTNLPENLKNRFVTDVEASYNTSATLIDQIAQNQNDLYIDTDSAWDGAGVFNVNTLSDKRFFKINPNTINFTKGNPTINKDGLSITLLPTVAFRPGDIIMIPNYFIDASISDPNAVSSTFNTNYIDYGNTTKENIGSSYGNYMIMELDYVFQNRESTFEINIRARSLNVIKNIVGE